MMLPRLVAVAAALLLSLGTFTDVLVAAQPSPPPQQPDGSAVSAAMLRRKSDEAMISGDLATAASYLAQLIDLEPTAASYLKRAALNQRRRDWSAVVADASRAIDAATAAAANSDAAAAAAVQQQGNKALLVRGQARTQLGECAAAVADLQRATGPEAAQPLDRAQRCAAALAALEHAQEQAEWRPVAEQSAPQQAALLAALDGVIALQLGGPEHYSQRAELHLAAGRLHEVILDTRHVLQANADDIPALTTRGDAYYLLGEHANAVAHYKQGLRGDPEHRVLQKRFKLVRSLMKKLDDAEEATQQGRHGDAVARLDEARDVDPRPRVVLGQIEEKKCAALLKVSGQGAAALTTCEAVAQRVNSADAWCQVGEAHFVREDWAAAEAAFNKASQTDQNSQCGRQGVHRAQVEVKKASRKDWYKILGVAKTANKKVIKKAYLKLAKQHHPDMVQGEAEKAEAESRFHDIGNAYEILIDDEKRGKYDRGEDIEMPQGPRGGGHGFPFPFHGFPGGGGGGGGGGGFHFHFG